MYSLKNNKLPRLHLKLNKYQIKSKNDTVIEYRKTIVSKDEYNYGMFYFIHIFYHPKYDWYSGDYEEKSIPIIARYDKKLLKYIEHIDD